jgi:uncharacterized protein YukE
MASQSFPYRLRLLAAALGLALLAAAEPASARPLERQEDQLRSALEDLTATLKTETEKLAGRAAEAAKGAEQTFGKAAGRMAEELETFARALSERKDTLGTLGRELSGQLEAWKNEELEAWREAMGESWFKMHHAMFEMLGRLNDWLRMQSEPEANPEIPV